MNQFERAITHSKLNVFSEHLKENNIISDLIEQDDGVPFLLVYFDGFEADLHCMPVEADDSFEHFLLVMTAQLSAPGFPLLNKQALCNLLNAQTKGGVAIVSDDEEYIVFRQVMQETALPMSKADLLCGVWWFEKGFEQLRAMVEALNAGNAERE